MAKSKMQITDVQVDCRNLTKKQINKMVNIFKKHNIPKCPTIKDGITNTSDYYLRVYNNNCKQITYLWYNENFIDITYSEFLNLFDELKRRNIKLMCNKNIKSKLDKNL